MYREGNYENNPDSLQRDALIQTLKKELWELQDREHEHLALENEIQNEEARYNLLQDEK